MSIRHTTLYSFKDWRVGGFLVPPRAKRYWHTNAANCMPNNIIGGVCGKVETGKLSTGCATKQSRVSVKWSEIRVNDQPPRPKTKGTAMEAIAGALSLGFLLAFIAFIAWLVAR